MNFYNFLLLNIKKNICIAISVFILFFMIHFYLENVKQDNIATANAHKKFTEDQITYPEDLNIGLIYLELLKSKKKPDESKKIILKFLSHNNQNLFNNFKHIKNIIDKSDRDYNLAATKNNVFFKINIERYLYSYSPLREDFLDFIMSSPVILGTLASKLDKTKHHNDEFRNWLILYYESYSNIKENNPDLIFILNPSYLQKKLFFSAGNAQAKEHNINEEFNKVDAVLETENNRTNSIYYSLGSSIISNNKTSPVKLYLLALMLSFTLPLFISIVTYYNKYIIKRELEHNSTF